MDGFGSNVNNALPGGDAETAEFKYEGNIGVHVGALYNNVPSIQSAVSGGWQHSVATMPGAAVFAETMPIPPSSQMTGAAGNAGGDVQNDGFFDEQQRNYGMIGDKQSASESVFLEGNSNFISQQQQQQQQLWTLQQSEQLRQQSLFPTTPNSGQFNNHHFLPLTSYGATLNSRGFGSTGTQDSYALQQPPAVASVGDTSFVGDPNTSMLRNTTTNDFFLGASLGFGNQPPQSQQQQDQLSMLLQQAQNQQQSSEFLQFQRQRQQNNSVLHHMDQERQNQLLPYNMNMHRALSLPSHSGLSVPSMGGTISTSNDVAGPTGVGGNHPFCVGPGVHGYELSLHSAAAANAAYMHPSSNLSADTPFVGQDPQQYLHEKPPSSVSNNYPQLQIYHDSHLSNIQQETPISSVHTGFRDATGPVLPYASAIPSSSTSMELSEAARRALMSVLPKRTNHNRSKKDKDRPKRPLSAYNLFFKDERAKLIAEAGREREKNFPGIKKRKRNQDGAAADPPAGRVGFEKMAKVIGARWKAISESELARYKQQADEEMKRYKSKVQEFMERKKLAQQEAAAKHESDEEESDVKQEQADDDGDGDDAANLGDIADHAET